LPLRSLALSWAANADAASSDVGLACCDFLFKSICYLKTVFEEIFKPVAQLLLLTYRKFQYGLFNLLKAAHGLKILQTREESMNQCACGKISRL
jgi:hypothetical protein